MIRIFIGYDKQEITDYHVLVQSILQHSTKPVTISPLNLSHYKDIFYRTRDQKQSTDFAFSRFLIPYLCNYEGFAIFLDCDMIVTEDINNLWNLIDDNYSVQCVKQKQLVKSGEKKLFNNIQYDYDKKNWSSVILFNNSKCKALTLDYVNSATGLELHQFKWLKSDTEIGELPKEWNYLVGYQSIEYMPPLIHYTLGSPQFDKYKKCEFSDLWYNYYNQINNL